MRHYLSNFSNDHRALMEEAIEAYGRGDIVLDPEPMPAKDLGVRYGLSTTVMDSYAQHRPEMMETHFSIFQIDSRDASEFWAVYDRLRALPRWKIFFTLSEDS